MTELVGLIEWAFGGFWRWLGFASLLWIVCGGTRALLFAILTAAAKEKGR